MSHLSIRRSRPVARDGAADSDQIGAELDRSKMTDDIHHGSLVGGRLPRSRLPARDSVANHLVSMAAVQPFDGGGQHGFVQVKSGQTAAQIADTGRSEER